MEESEVQIGMRVRHVMHHSGDIGIITSKTSDGNFYVVRFSNENVCCNIHFLVEVKEIKEERMDELKFGDLCMAWDDDGDKNEYAFICKTPQGVMVAEIDDYEDNISHDAIGNRGGEYWFGFYKYAELIKVREMTVAEIEEALGFSIKIVKEDK